MEQQSTLGIFHLNKKKGMIMVYQIMSGMKRTRGSNYYFVPLKRQKRMLEMIAGQNKEPASHDARLACS